MVSWIEREEGEADADVDDGDKKDQGLLGGW